MSNNPKQSWSEWSDENSEAIEAAQAASAEPCGETTGQARALAVAPGSAEQRALSLRAAILWGEGDESLAVSLGVAAAMEPTEDEGSCAARLLASEVRRLNNIIDAAHRATELECTCGGNPAEDPECCPACKVYHRLEAAKRHFSPNVEDQQRARA